MEEPVVKGIVISLVVVLLASLIGILLSLVVVGQSILGGGQSKLQTGLTQIQQQDLQQYSNKNVKGSIVKSTISQYESEQIGILVKTTALFNVGTSEPSEPTSGQGNYVNYGVLIDGASTEMIGPAGNQTEHMILDAGTGSSTSPLATLAGESFLEADLDFVNGVPQTNYDTSGISAVGNLETILDNGVFYSQLVKNISGEIIGIVFTQRK